MRSSFALVLPALAAAFTLGCAAPARHGKNSPGPKEGLQARLERLNQAKFGIFIHWGPYCVLGGRYKNGPKNRAEWIQLQEKIPAGEYEKIARTFDPVKFDAGKWVELFEAAGARYVVITSKHHDGFCMFDTRQTDYDIVDFTPFKRDPLKELARACRKSGLKLGFYYSLVDWHHPEFPAKYSQRGFHGRPNPKADLNKYDQYLMNQVKELLTNYGPVFVVWFDGGGSFRGYPRFKLLHGDKILALIRKLQPDCLVNNRLGKGDYGTPEQRIPGKIQDQAFEVCMTIGRHWGYNKFEKKFKSAKNLIRKLVDIAHKGGNFLLNVGPKPDGTIPRVFQERLLAMGKWLKVNGEAIYGAKASPFSSTPWGRCTCRKLGGGKIRLYLHVFERPAGGILRVPALSGKTRALEAFMLAGKGRKPLEFSQPGPGKETRIQLPPVLPDPVSTTVVLDIS